MTSVRKYIWKKKAGFTDSQGLTVLMLAAAKAVISGRGGFTLTQDGEPISKEVSRRDVLSRLKQAVSSREIGSTFRIRDAKGDVVFTCRAVREAVVDDDATNGNHVSDVYYTWIVARYRTWRPRYAGSYVCKHIAGSSSMSQHSYGNAVDFFFDSLAHQDSVAAAVVANYAELHVDHVISRNRIWELSNGRMVERYYGGEYHYHLHVDFVPQYSGGCGVRG